MHNKYIHYLQLITILTIYTDSNIKLYIFTASYSEKESYRYLNRNFIVKWNAMKKSISKTYKCQ